MNTMERPIFVAETDATGRVTHVSLSLPNLDYIASAEQGDALETVLEVGEFHGAPKQDISAWLIQKWRKQ